MSSILELFPWSAQARVISFLLNSAVEDPDRAYNRHELAEGSKIHNRTLNDVIKQLEEYHIVKKIHVGQRDIFQLQTSTMTSALIRLETELQKI